MNGKWSAESELAKAVILAGFDYDPDQDIIFSRRDAWQKDFGYGYSYDLAAPVSIGAVIDCEPFFFRYNNADWMIELWKGQYRLQTGCEIGVYVSTRDRPLLDATLGNRPHDPTHSRFYDCAYDRELLTLSSSLLLNGQPLFNRGPEKHWWLTGFKWGVLSNPEDLKMAVNITFTASDMQQAFLSAMEKTGYGDVTVDGKKVSFIFDKPKTVQPRLDPSSKKMIDSVQQTNKQIMDQYKNLGLTSNDPNLVPDEFVDYFRNLGPKSFEDFLKEGLKNFNYDVDQISNAIGYLRDQNIGIISKILNNLIGFLKKIIGK